MSVSTIEQQIRKTARKLRMSGTNTDDILNELKELFKELSKELKTSILSTIVKEYEWIADKTLDDDIRNLIRNALRLLQEDFSKLDKRIDAKLSNDIYGLLNRDFSQVDLNNTIESSLGVSKYVVKTLTRTITGAFDTLGFVKDMAETDELEYIGPPAERPFCREHLGKTLTVAEWKRKSNGQGLPVLLYRGGYNCRHSFGLN